jgi:hypothetical protein
MSAHRAPVVLAAEALTPATELLIAALQFLNHGEAMRARLAAAVTALPEPDAADAGATILALRQAAAVAVRGAGAGIDQVGGKSGAGLARVHLDRALRAHCQHVRERGPAIGCEGRPSSAGIARAFGSLMGAALS